MARDESATWLPKKKTRKRSGARLDVTTKQGIEAITTISPLLSRP
jgi:hypothetical protein